MSVSIAALGDAALTSLVETTGTRHRDRLVQPVKTLGPAAHRDGAAMNAADLIDLQRLRSERPLLESANEHVQREYAQAQEEIRILRGELARMAFILQRALGEPSSAACSPGNPIKAVGELGPIRVGQARRRSRSDVALDAS